MRKIHGDIKLKCEVCQKAYFIYPSRLNKRRTCSKKCEVENRTLRRIIKNCIYCKKIMPLTLCNYSQRKVCSMACRKMLNIGRNFSDETKKKLSLSHKAPRPYRRGVPIYSTRGERNNNWKGGITPLREKIRRIIEYVEWRRNIYKRDNFTCVICGIRGGTLHVDHCPIPFSIICDKFNIKTIDEARLCKVLWDIDNGRTLCKECHRKTDTYGCKALKFVTALLPNNSSLYA